MKTFIVGVAALFLTACVDKDRPPNKCVLRYLVGDMVTLKLTQQKVQIMERVGESRFCYYNVRVFENGRYVERHFYPIEIEDKR